MADCVKITKDTSLSLEDPLVKNRCLISDFSLVTNPLVKIPDCGSNFVEEVFDGDVVLEAGSVSVSPRPIVKSHAILPLVRLDDT